MPSHHDLLTLCHDLARTGIWLTLKDDGGLMAGPTKLLQANPDFVVALKEHKTAILRLLEDSLAGSGLGATVDARFDREECPFCHQQVYVVLGPRRLGVHRLPGNLEVCAGSDRAQAVAADQIMQAFVMDRCERKRGATLSWIGIRGALGAWCAVRDFLLPPRPFLWAWMDHHFAQVGKDADSPRWEGLQLVLQEWHGAESTGQGALPLEPPQTKKGVLTAS